jgi:hypothetical protein
VVFCFALVALNWLKPTIKSAETLSAQPIPLFFVKYQYSMQDIIYHNS